MTHNKEFFRYVLPSMLAFALSGVYAIADGFFVGNALGDDALAAINIAYPLTAFLQAAGTGIGMGGAIQYAISTGRKEYEKARQSFGISLILLAFFGLFHENAAAISLKPLQLFISAWLMHALRTRQNYPRHAKDQIPPSSAPRKQQ